MRGNHSSKSPAIILGNLLIPGLLISTSASALAADICWIDHVEKSTTGVNVYFSSSRWVRVQRHDDAKGSRQETIVIDMNATENQQDKDGNPVRKFVAAAEGDQMFASNMPEDSCAITVVKQHGVIGVKAASAMNLPGIPSTHTEKFIPAK